jgi:Ni/Fe-hydrogenase 1 B-type cytochrome subunit
MTLFFVLQVMTGLSLIADTSAWWFPNMFKWVSTMFGGDITTRYIHHILTWLFMAFIIVHVYLVLFHDYVEARGEASAMISGFKFIRAERLEEDEAEIISKAKEQMWEGKEQTNNKKTSKKT